MEDDVGAGIRWAVGHCGVSVGFWSVRSGCRGFFISGERALRGLLCCCSVCSARKLIAWGCATVGGFGENIARSRV